MVYVNADGGIPSPASADGLTDIRIALVDLTRRVATLEKTLSVLAGQAAAAPLPPVPGVPTAPATQGANSYGGTFDGMFLREVGILHPELLERTRQVVYGQAVQLSDTEQKQLLDLLDPYLAP